ncbi:MAG: hypothetical protein HGA85_04595, partial [Nanoarchaeota archaeon]|nr:hypothetical protein [Nanoarchaeota archaeon]
MITTIIIILGILMQVYALFLCKRLFSIISEKEHRKAVFVLFLLICFFLIGYCIYLYLLLTELKQHDPMTSLISGIFFFGAVFVVIVLKTNYRFLQKINADNAEIKKDTKKIEEKNEELDSSNKELSKVKTELARKNKELESTLEEFYTFRLSMEKNLKEDSIKKENK